jgi:hypothetical protein
MNANKQDAGGLPALPPSYGDHCVTDSVRTMREPGYTADQMRAYGDQCYAMGAADVASYEQTLRNFGRNDEQCRAASVAEVETLLNELESEVASQHMCVGDREREETEDAIARIRAAIIRALSRGVPEGKCWCRTCDPVTVRMALCPDCGNKRCPKANDHRNTCTNSNEPGQPGSAYPAIAAQRKEGGLINISQEGSSASTVAPLVHGDDYPTSADEKRADWKGRTTGAGS